MEMLFLYSGIYQAGKVSEGLSSMEIRKARFRRDSNDNVSEGLSSMEILPVRKST